MARVSVPEFWTDLYGPSRSPRPAPWLAPTALPPSSSSATIFTLRLDYERTFDGVWEYGCFCAIDPTRRVEYVRAMGAILRPGGWLPA